MLDTLLISSQEIPVTVLNNTLLKYLPAKEKPKVAEAFYYLLKKYRQKGLARDNGYPAEIHPVSVAKTLDFDAHLMKVALLHDVVEEFDQGQEIILKEIEEQFGTEVKTAVLELTNSKINPKIVDEDYQKYVKQITRIDCLIVKQADVLDNIRTSYSRKLAVQKKKLPEKVDIVLQHIGKINPSGNILYQGAFYKYHAKIIEEIFRLYERQLKNIQEQHKVYLKDIVEFEAILLFYYKKYGLKRKEIYKRFLDILVSNNELISKHLEIELQKRTKEALITKLPLNSMLISINQHISLYKASRLIHAELAKKLRQSILQQIRLSRVEAIRLLNYYSIMLDNKKLLNKEWAMDIPFNPTKITSIRKSLDKLTSYEAMLHE